VFAYGLPDGEGCPLNFAPMASTTMQLIWGDALAAERMVSSSFTLEGFARNHPGGSLGARLLAAKDLMHPDFPIVSPGSGLVQILAAMTAGKLGMAAVAEPESLAGVISDGDIRRALEGAGGSGQNPLELRAEQIMAPAPTTIAPGAPAIEAAKLIETKKITFLVVADGGRPIGILHIHDLLAAKVI
jgi:arabinose-5-phosphate isomerase